MNSSTVARKEICGKGLASLGWSPFERLHVLLPVLAVLVGLLLEYMDIDLRLEALFFDTGTKTWPWMHDWLLENVMHKGGRNLIVVVGVVNLLALLGSFVFAPLAEYRKLLLCLLLAMGIGPVLVGVFKDVTHIYSPWDLAYFGGKQEYVKLLDAVPVGAPVGHAFPAGHASGGFALVASYFALGMVYPRLRFFGLGIGLGVGFLLGFGQQMRGAHFLSHDLFALAVCWCGALLVFFLFYGRAFTRRIDPSFG